MKEKLICLAEFLHLIKRRPRPLKGVPCRMSGYARGDDVCIPKVYFHDKTLWVGTSSTHWQRFEVEFVPEFNGDIPALGGVFHHDGNVEFDLPSVVESE